MDDRQWGIINKSSLIRQPEDHKNLYIENYPISFSKLYSIHTTPLGEGNYGNIYADAYANYIRHRSTIKFEGTIGLQEGLLWIAFGR